VALFWVIGAMDWVLFGNVGDSLLWLFLIHKNQKSVIRIVGESVELANAGLMEH